MDIKLIDVARMPVAARTPAIAYYYQLLESENRVKSSFFDGSVQNISQFYDFCLDKRNIFILIWDEDKHNFVAHCFLNDFSGLVCKIHFGLLKSALGGYGIQLAKLVTKRLFAFRRADSDLPLMTSLIGVTPETNKLAVRFLQRAGFKVIDYIPHLCYLYYEKQYVPGFVSRISNTDLAGE